jgi:hypothetical protein
MRRRDFLSGLCATAAVAVCPRLAVRASASGPNGRPLEIGPGTQLFLDDYLIDEVDGLKRQVQQPQRFGPPVLDSKTFGVTQPYLTVLRDRDQGGGRFRLWYDRGPALWHADSLDGIHWANPRLAWALPRNYGASLIDDAERAPEASRRFKLASWQATRSREDRPGDDSGMWVGFSPDGFAWTSHAGNPVLPTWPEGYGQRVRHGVGDIVDVASDPIARRYVAAVKVHALEEDGYAPGPRAGTGIRRLVGMSTSTDFVHWEKPWRILAPDDQDEGLMEFYGMGGFHVRGGLRIGLVRVLRDDLPRDPGGPSDGIGYTVLATSRDGLTWRRDRTPFLPRNPEPGSWDHAMAWMSAAVPVGDEVYFYYGGYARGHKIAAATERQIGLARMKKDRYSAIIPERPDREGRLRTPPFVLPGDRLTINADASRGRIDIRLLDSAGTDASAARPITADVFASEVRWPGASSSPLTALRGRPVRLEFRVRAAALYGFDVRDAPG